MFIAISQLTHAFDQKGLKAIDNINITISHPGLYFLMGPSGHGKSTLINLLKGRLQTQKGTVYIKGQNQQTNPRDSSPEHFFNQSHIELAKHNLQKFLGELAPLDEDPVEVARHMALELNLEKHLRKDLSQLSQGQLARAWLGRQLGSRQNVLLLDEPFQHLDPPLMREVVALLRSLAISKDVAILLASHDRELALAFAHEIIFLHLGKILQHASGEEIYHRPSHHQVANFFGPTNILLGERTSTGGWETCLGSINMQSSASILNTKRTLVIVPPEKIYLTPISQIRGVIVEKLFAGDTWLLKLDINHTQGPIFIRVPYQSNEGKTKIGDDVGVQLLDEIYHAISEVI